MKESPQAKRNSKRTDRRTLLKSGAVGLASLIAGTGFGSADDATSSTSAPRGSTTYTAKGGRGAAISEEHRRQVRARAVRDFERKNGHSPEAVPGSEHRSKSGEVVAYAYAIDANGTARSYTGIAGEDATEPETESGRAEALIHDRFGGRVAELSHAVAASEQQVTTMAGGTVSGTENMEQVYSDKLEYAEDPYGVVGSTFYWFRDNLDSTEGDVHSFHSPAGFEPGHQAFGSGYTNNWGRVFNRWNKSQMGNTDVDYGQWNPYGTQGGSSTTAYSLSVSAGWMTA
ncbi:hypothetical protein SAMN05421858_2328 [Haladaptatus litoreus]|uniref:Uncharacterized protein n=1 Tax=Haladaptatus litoreus TaxID=553468 RepID=A0A1N7B4I8_9EURY|nr:hypothetical protein [Haladaptatus litoreus]SIR46188.1 hypothetical protein SAMN05421858_2328 [Haladaptatus litoreus]